MIKKMCFFVVGFCVGVLFALTIIQIKVDADTTPAWDQMVEDGTLVQDAAGNWTFNHESVVDGYEKYFMVRDPTNPDDVSTKDNENVVTEVEGWGGLLLSDGLTTLNINTKSDYGREYWNLGDVDVLTVIVDGVPCGEVKP